MITLDDDDRWLSRSAKNLRDDTKHQVLRVEGLSTVPPGILGPYVSRLAWPSGSSKIRARSKGISYGLVSSPFSPNTKGS